MPGITNKIILFVLLTFILIICFFCIKKNNGYNFENKNNYEISFSKESGFYDNDFELEIKGEGEIYYTLDGSIPTRQSNRYTGSIHITDASKNPNTNSMNKNTSIFFDIPCDDPNMNKTYEVPNYLIDKCNIVRAVSFLKDGSKTDVISASYFVGFKDKEEYKDIGIISLITDPKNLFDKKRGIYILRKITFKFDEGYGHILHIPNFDGHGKKFERIAYIEIFNENRDLILQKDIGIRIHGRSTRERNPKSLNIYFRDEYDKENNFYGNIIDEDYNPKELTLLYPSTDNTRMKDFLVMSLCDNANVASMKFKPYLLFLDGEYWGFYYLTEKYGTDFISYHYNIEDKNNIIMIKAEDDVYFGEFEEALDLIRYGDFSKEQKYDVLCNIVDIDSLIEYLAILIYTGRRSIFVENCGVWKTIKIFDDKYQNGKWHFMLYDMDGICENYNFDKNNIGECVDYNIILKLIKNNRFREKLYDKLISISRKEFNPTVVEDFIRKNKDYIKKYVINDYKRFYGINEQKSNKIFEENVGKVISFFKNRSNNILKVFNEDLFIGERVI